MGKSTRTDWYRAFALLAALALLAMAWANRLTFPYPWNDEARFFLPALWFAKHGSLDPMILNAPDGIFWVPDGFTVTLGLVLRLFGESIQVARATCECLVAAGIACFAYAFRVLSGSNRMGMLATALLLTPPVVYCANMVRMEAPLFLLIALVLLLHVNGYFLGAAALLMGSLLFHPALALAAAAYSVLTLILLLLKTRSHLSHVIEWVLFAMVISVLVLEGLRIAHHFELFKLHMAYQATRKLSTPMLRRFMKPQGAMLVLCSAASFVILLRRRAWERWEADHCVLGTAIIALGVQAYAVIGAEYVYNVYSLSLAPAIIFCLVAHDIARESKPLIHTVSNGVVSAADVPVT